MKQKILLVLAILTIIFVSGCVEKQQEPTPLTAPEADITKPVIEWGIGVYPANGFTNPNKNDWDNAFQMAKSVGKIAHLELTDEMMTLNDMFMLSDLKVPLARKYGMEVFIQINTFGKIPDPIRYRNEAVEIAKKYQPEYLCLGQEINYVFDDNPEQKYKQFVKDLLITYQEVKKVSPNTEVFPSFAYEPMRAKHQEFLFNDFKDAVPYFPMTSYPMNILELYPKNTYNSPKDIPINYWDVSDITDKDVFITETGWSTDKNWAKWGASRQNQAEFIYKVYDLVNANPKVKKVVWITMMDVVDENTSDTYGYPGTMGFFTIDGKDKGNWLLIRK